MTQLTGLTQRAPGARDIVRVLTLTVLIALFCATGGLGATQTDTLTLTQAYDAAERASPRLAMARYGAQAAEAREPSARKPMDPELQLGAMNVRLPSFSADMPASMAPSIQLMQRLPVRGQLKVSGRIAAHETAAARAAAREAWWLLRAEVAQRYFALYAADRQIATMERTTELLRSYQTVAHAMYAAGSARQSDVLRAGVEVTRMQAEIRRMRGMRAAEAAMLNALLGRAADTSIDAVAAPQLPLHVPPLDSLRVLADSDRPQLERARVLVQQARARRDLATRELWPDLALGVSYGQQRIATMNGGARETEHMGSVMLGFSVPVFAGSRQLRMREEAAAMQRMAEADLADMRLEIDARLAGIAAELAQARELISLYRTEIIPQTDATVQSSFASYRVGAVDFMTLVDAQMAANRYRSELYQLIADYAVAVARLEAETGRALPADVIVEDV